MSGLKSRSKTGVYFSQSLTLSPRLKRQLSLYNFHTWKKCISKKTWASIDSFDKMSPRWQTSWWKAVTLCIPTSAIPELLFRDGWPWKRLFAFLPRILRNPREKLRKTLYFLCLKSLVIELVSRRLTFISTEANVLFRSM